MTRPFSQVNALPIRDSANVAMSKMALNDEDLGSPKEVPLVADWNKDETDTGSDPGLGLASLDQLRDSGARSPAVGLAGLDDMKFDLTKKRLPAFTKPTVISRYQYFSSSYG